MSFGSSDSFSGYEDLPDEDLIHLSGSFDELTGQAQQALLKELSRRGLDPAPQVSVPPQITSRKLITVARYRDLSEAIVARSFLEASGISVFLCDENLVRLDWQISNFIGGIRLQVEQGDEAEALELLTQPTFDTIDYGSESQFTQPHCPVCNASDVTFQGSSRKAAIASLYLFAVPLPLGKETWRCNVCGAHWEDSGDP